MESPEENLLPKQPENELMQILNSKPVEKLVETFSAIMKQNAENEQKRLEVEGKRIDFETKELELENKEIVFEESKLKSFLAIDKLTKVYNLISVLVVGGIIYLFRQSNILDNSSTQILLTIIVTLLLSGNLPTLKNLFNKNT